MPHDTECFCERLKGELSFYFLSQEDSPIISVLLECRKVAAGEVLWREGDTCDCLAFIVSGRLEIRKQTEFPGKDVIVGIYGKGSIVGELCLLSGHERFVTVAALEDADLLLLSRENFQRLTREAPELAVRLLQGVLLAVSTRLGKSFERLASVF